uniref:DszB n=1 Tax=Rhodococcus sp. SDUZAWQ TaxID=299114 RepID=Q5U773_9NOCA|nr:DszB [Rhodococcus sp. SDUZAWQ]
MTSRVDPANPGSELDSAIRDTLTYSNCPVPNALLTASESVFLDAAGIELDVLSGQQGTVHFTYDQPAYTRFGGEIPPLLSEGLRAPGRTRLLGITPLLGRQGFFVRDDSPVTAAADLAGRRIGVSASAIRILRGQLGDYLELDPWRQTLVALGSWEARALLHTLEHGELGVDDVELVPISSPGVDVPAEQLEESATVKGADLFPDVARGQAAVLASGDVDALYSWLPWAGELQATGARPVVDLGLDERNAYASVWTVSSGLVRQRPGLVQRLVDAAVDAGLWARDHSDAVTSLHAANLGVSTGAVGQGFGADFQQRLAPRLDHDALALLERTQQFLLTNNLLQEPVALDQWAAPEFLNNSLNRHR